MGRNNYFQFKQFKIIQEKAAMKVGTDGVLLGAWVDVLNEKKILDIGTGTGLIALMMAQRTTAEITAIEIEQKAAEEAVFNIKNSNWSNRVHIENVSFQEFANTTDETFDLIISNPPFFINDQKSRDNNLAIAKHNDLLPLPDLVNGCKKLLSKKGKLAVILPVMQAKNMITLCNQNELFLNQLTFVRPNYLKEVHRYLMEFLNLKTDVKTNELAIHENDSSGFTQKYKTLTSEFYLNF